MLQFILNGLSAESENANAVQDFLFSASGGLKTTWNMPNITMWLVSFLFWHE